MMLGVVAVKEPDPVVKFIVTAHAPGHGFVGIAAVMAIVTVQVREGVTEIPKRHQKNRCIASSRCRG
jgi:hypothetical protein